MNDNEDDDSSVSLVEYDEETDDLMKKEMSD